MKIKDKAYCNSFRQTQCIISWFKKEWSDPETVCGHHLSGRLRDDLQIPLSFKYHTGEKGIHTVGKKTWHNKYISKEDCIELAEFSYSFWLDNKVNLFSLPNINEVLTIYFENK